MPDPTDSSTDSSVMCCIPGSPGIPASQSCPARAAATSTATPWTAPARRSTLQDVRWWVPRGELRDCIENGSCSLEQIMMVIAAFANFLLTISGSLLLLAFVVGGAFYLTAAGSAERAKKGMKMITDASIGIVIIVLAGTIVRFVYRSLTPSTDTCSTQHPGYVCQFVPGANEQERSRNGVGCEAGGCASGASDGLMCCPVTQTRVQDPNTAPNTSPSTPAATPAR